MDRHIPELLAEVTNVLTLEPGDVVATGTHHFGLEPVQDGDTVRLQIEQLGPALRRTVRRPVRPHLGEIGKPRARPASTFLFAVGGFSSPALSANRIRPGSQDMNFQRLFRHRVCDSINWNGLG